MRRRHCSLGSHLAGRLTRCVCICNTKRVCHSAGENEIGMQLSGHCSSYRQKVWHRW